MSEIKYLNLKVFRDEGFLLEANRLFFHPLGLALGVYYDENDIENTKGIDPEKDEPKGLVIYDSRDDPEGTAYYSLADDGDQEKYDNVTKLREEKANIRLEKFGWVIQPMGHKFEDD